MPLRVLQVAVLVLAAGFIYAPAFHGGWLWDDNEDLPHNPLLRVPNALSQIWFHPPTLDYYPLKTTLQWLQWQLWHNDTLGYHLTNVALHLLGALLLWRLFRQLGVRLAWLGALVFLVHPVAVESVAWITELKNVLSLPPLLLAMSAYLESEAVGPAAGRAARRRYCVALAWFLVAMLCKSSVAMFPFALLLHGWWKHGRISGKTVRASVPFFAVSLVLGLVAVWLQQHRSIGAGEPPIGGFALRAAVAGKALLFYFYHCIVPTDLTPLYPRWPVAAGSPLAYGPWFVLAAGAVICWTRREGWGRHALFGLGWFALNAAPALGFVTVSTMRFTWVMDHFVYVSLPGLIGLAMAGAGVLAARLPAPGRLAAGLAAGACCAALALASRGYAAAFSSEAALWSHAAGRHPDSWMAQNNLGAALLDQGRTAEAQARLTEALRLNPDYADAHDNLARVLTREGKRAEAIVQEEIVVRLRPGDGLACASLGAALAASGRLPEAEAQDARAAELLPGNAAIRNDLGLALARLGRTAEAIDQFTASLQLQPGDGEVETNLGGALGQAGRLPEAISHLEAAVRLEPASVRAHFNLGAALLQADRRDEGRRELEAALRLNPTFGPARELLAR